MASVGARLRSVPWLELALAALLVALVAALTGPPTKLWFKEDDFRNTRWVLEYWDAPWRALTERHAMHGHIRPLVNMTLWAVTPKVGDPYLPQLTALHVLRGLALLGVGALTLRLGGTRLAALVAMGLGASLHGFQLLGGWIAWVCSAGQIALGLWALVAFDWSLERRKFPWAAVVLAVGAGLYKEPGWIVVPAGALALSLARGRVPRSWAVFALIGVAGMVYAWHPDNATRFASGAGLGTRLWEGLTTLPGAAVSGWPAWRPDGEGALPGVPMVFVAGVLATGLVEGVAGYALWAAAVGVGFAGPAYAGIATVVLAAATVLRHPTRPPVGLVLFLVETGLSLPLDIRNEVQALGGSLGLALHTALGLPRLVRAGRGAAAAVGLGAVAWIGGTALALAREPAPEPADLAARDRIYGITSLVSVMGPSEVVKVEPFAISDELLPFTGMFERAKLAKPASMALGDHLLLNPPPGAFERALVVRSRVSPSSVPWLGALATSVEDLPRDGKVRVLEPGLYAIGIAPLRLGGRTFGSAIHAQDTCGRRWSAGTFAADVPVAVEVVRVHEGCEGVKLGWTGEKTLEALFLLAPLDPDPALSVEGRVPAIRHLEVRVRPTEALERR